MIEKYAQLKDNPNYAITLVLDDRTQATAVRRTIKSVLQNDIAIAGGNDFTTAGDIIRDLPIGGELLKLKDRAAGVSKALGTSVVSQFETSLVWSNSMKPVIPIEMTFYQDNAQKNILEDYLKIKSAVLPSQRGAFFQSPLGYKVGDFKSRTLKQQGMVIISIGKWLRMTDMVIRDESFTLSKEVNKEGQPLFITGSITLEPSRALTYKEFQAYFVKTRRV